MKAGNRLEDKTERTLHWVAVGHRKSNASIVYEGTKINRSVRDKESSCGHEDN